MKIKKIISCLLVVTMLATAMYCPVIAIEDKDYSYKIDSVLAEKLDKMSDDDTIEVSVWVTDIDHNEVERKAIEIVKDSVSKDVLEIAKAENDSNKLMELSRKESIKSIAEQKRDSLQIQKYIEAKRNIASDLQYKSNKRIIQCLFPSDLPEITYCGRFAPNFCAVLTKDQIININFSNSVANIYESVHCEYDIDDISEETTDLPVRTTTYNTTSLSVAGLTTTRDAYGLTGNGVKVGIFDSGFLYPNEVDYFQNNNIDDYQISNDTHADGHGIRIACLIGGYKSGQNGSSTYVSGAPNSTMYLKSGEEYKTSIEWLISKGSNVINMSLTITGSPNTYTDISKWIDHVSYQHSVHFSASSGNHVNVGVYQSSMAYNIITVGCSLNNGTCYSLSSYVNDNAKAFKPDVLAPAESIIMPAGQTGATSGAAAVMSCALAQFCELSAALKVSPTLMKALVLAGSKRSPYMISNNIQSTANTASIAIDHQYGCGILRATNMYDAFQNNQYYTYTLGAQDEFVTETRYISVKGTNKQLRVAATWDKTVNINSQSHTDDNLIISDEELDCFILTVTDPNNNTYSMNYPYDNKSFVSFHPTSSGYYTFTLSRTNNSENAIKLSFAYSMQIE